MGSFAVDVPAGGGPGLQIVSEPWDDIKKEWRRVARLGAVTFVLAVGDEGGGHPLVSLTRSGDAINPARCRRDG
jgi:hypothetical protein